MDDLGGAPRQAAGGDRSPMAMRRAFGARLKVCREDHGLTLEGIAAITRMSTSTLSRIENGLRAVEPVLLPGLLDAYRVIGTSDRDALARLAVGGFQDAWWTEYHDVMPKDLHFLLSLEQDSRRARCIATSAIHALVQTRAYAAAINEGTWFIQYPPAKQERLVEFRLARQKVLSTLSLEILIDEAALVRQVGGLAVMREQLARLVELVDRNALSLRVLPFSSGAYPAMFSNLVIFDGSGQGGVAYIETSLGSMYLNKAAELARAEQAYALAAVKALDRKASYEVLADLAERSGS